MCDGNICSIENNDKIEDVIVGLSFACNLNCYHCWYAGHHYDSSKQKELYFHVLNSLRNLKLNTLTLTNKGEPFFYTEETLALLKSLTQNDVTTIASVTNGTLLTEKVTDELSSIKRNTGINYRFIFSIDAISSAIYDKVRFGGNFNTVIKNMERCINKFGKKYVIVSFTCKTPNISEINQVKRFYKENFGVNTIISYDSYNLKLKKIVKKQYGDEHEY